MPKISQDVARRISRETLVSCLMAFAMGCGMVTVKPVAPPVPATEILSEEFTIPLDLDAAAADAAEVEAINSGHFQPYQLDSSSALN